MASKSSEIELNEFKDLKSVASYYEKLISENVTLLDIKVDVLPESKRSAVFLKNMLKNNGIPCTLISLNENKKSSTSIDYEHNKVFFETMMRAENADKLGYYINMVAREHNGILHLKPVVHTFNLYGACKNTEDPDVSLDCDLICKYIMVNGDAQVLSNLMNEIYSTFSAARENVAPAFEHAIFFEKNNTVMSAALITRIVYYNMASFVTEAISEMFQWILYNKMYILWRDADVLLKNLVPQNIRCMSENSIRIINYEESSSSVSTDNSINEEHDQRMLFMLSVLRFIKSARQNKYLFDDGIFLDILRVRDEIIEYVQLDPRIFDPLNGMFNNARDEYLNLLVAHIVLLYAIAYVSNVPKTTRMKSNDACFSENMKNGLANRYPFDKFMQSYGNAKSKHYQYFDIYVNRMVELINTV